MFLGVSHIVLGSASIERDAARFVELGYDHVFTERGLTTHAGKLPFMAQGSASQTLAFFAAPRGPGIELIAYRDALPTCSAPFQIPLAASVPENATPIAIDEIVARAWSEGIGPLPRAATVPGLASPLWFAERSAGAGTIVHAVHDLDAARAFWTKLGWSVPKARGAEESAVSGSGWLRLDFPSAVAQWRASMLLVESAAAVSSSLLDAAGFRCLSFITSDLAGDREVLRRAGAERSTGRMDYVINRRSLALEIFAGPDGAMIELLEVVRGRS